MTYHSWLLEHAKKHAAIIDKLQKRGLDSKAVLEYFRFDNMVNREPDFCPLYAKSEPCHAMSNLNCYFCACPHFRFSDSGLESNAGVTRYSDCAIHAAQGDVYRYGNALHQDCSGCLLPHRESVIRKMFAWDWMEIMQNCAPKTT